MKIKNVNDYVDSVREKFPELTKQEVKRILVYGWKQIIQYISAGNDVSIITNKEFMFIGEIPKNSLSTFKTYCSKLSKRIGYMFKRTKSKWDGYYYFTRNENQYAEYLSQSKKKYKIFKNVILFKLLEELKVYNPAAPYIFRLKENKTKWMHKRYNEIRTKNAELIVVRDPLKMNDIMTSYNKYKYIQQ